MIRDGRVRSVGDSVLIVEREGGSTIDPAVNAWAVALSARLSSEPSQGVRDILPTFSTVAVYFDAARTDTEALRARLTREALIESADADHTRTAIRVPVCYGGEHGPDLVEVAAFAGLDVREVIARHTSTAYRVFMLGFVPGFAYLGPVDPLIAMPRRSSPRLKVPAGSVGIAGQQTGVYPQESPGGWRLIGRTPLRMFDHSRPTPSLVQPGDTVQFDAISIGQFERLERDAHRAVGPTFRSGVDVMRGTNAVDGSINVVRPGLLTTVQDEGRWGMQAQGVPVAGPMDSWSFRAANALVGNTSHDAALEITLRGPELEFECGCVVAIAGAEFGVTLDRAAAPLGRPFTVPAGATLRFGERRSGARAYLAVSGGLDVPPVLGSRSTHLISKMGGFDGRPLAAGDQLRVRVASAGAVSNRSVSYSGDEPRLARSGSRSHARLRVLPGPQGDLFEPRALKVLQSSAFTIAQESDRMGFRLEGPSLAHAGGAVVSDATPLGTLQVPPSGQPLLLMADRQTTGGYPKLAIVISADIGIAGQLAPGDTVSFEVCSMREAVAALIARERTIMGLEARV